MNSQITTDRQSQALTPPQQKGTKLIPLFHLAVWNMATLGIYGFYWSYSNWKVLREQLGLKVLPELRLIGLLTPFVSPFMIWSQFRLIKKLALSHKIETTYSPLLAASGYVLFNCMAAVIVFQGLTQNEPTHYFPLVIASLAFYLALSTWIMCLVQKTLSQLVDFFHN